MATEKRYVDTRGPAEHLATSLGTHNEARSRREPAVQTHYANLGCGSRRVVLPSPAPRGFRVRDLRGVLIIRCQMRKFAFG